MTKNLRFRIKYKDGTIIFRSVRCTSQAQVDAVLEKFKKATDTKARTFDDDPVESVTLVS